MTDVLNDVVSPAELSKWDVFRMLNWRAHRAQRLALEATERIRVISAGRRMGKSEIGGHELVPEALATAAYAETLREERKRREFWIVGPEYTDSEKEFRIFWNECSRLELPFDKPGSYNDPLGGNMHVSLWGGAFQVHAKSAKHPETLVGEGLSGVILAEAAKLKHRVWTKFIRPMLADYQGWALMVSTPEGKNWFYEAWQNGTNPNMPDWWSMRLPSWRNPYVYRKPTKDEEVKKMHALMKQIIGNRRRTAYEIVKMFQLDIDDEIVSMADDLTEEAFNQEIGADFSEFVGRVFKEFDEEIHVRDLEFNAAWQTYACTDYGFTNPNVWLLIQVGPWGEVHVLDEVYERGMTADEFAYEVKNRNMCPWNIITFYPDPEDPGSTRTLENILKVRHSGGTGGLRKDRINSIREALKRIPGYLPDEHAEKLPTVLFNRKCTNTIREMLDYKYPDTREEADRNSKEEPLDKDNHCPEALGRFMAGRFGTPSTQRGGMVKHTATATRGARKKPATDPTVNADGTLRYRHSQRADNVPQRQMATPEQLASTKKRNWT